MQLKKRSLIFGVAALLAVSAGSAQAAKTVSLSEKNDSKTVHVKLGTHVQLTLHSMYWQLSPLPKDSSLTSDGAPVLKPILPGPSAPSECRIAGSGCGTQTWRFTATKVGTTKLMASRTTCGEAMRCTGKNGEFAVTVKVGR